MPLSDSLKTLSHHAYLLIGSEEIHAELISILEKKHKIATHANPDFFDLKYQTLTIDNAREVKSLAGTKPMYENAKEIFILTMNGITVEAQNALLKLLEEPPEYAHFFLIVPSAHLLLPTVKSRLATLSVSSTFSKGSALSSGKVVDSEIVEEAAAFVKMSAAKRLEFIKDLMDDISKEKKSKQHAIELLNGIESVLYEKGRIKEARHALETIDTARKYLNDRAPSVKMLLEYVALNV
jgi:DNA polymerase III delta prime subunit